MNLDENLFEDYIVEMARVGMMKQYEVYVRTDDPGKPHFHIWDYSTKGKEFHTCIRIDKAEYFHHEGKRGVLNTKEKKELVAFLQSRPENRHYNTRWEYLVDMWNDNNSSIRISDDTVMPNYQEMV